MKFVRQEDLKAGMRLARPIYSKRGVLLYDRDCQLSQKAIESVRNFGLLGIYILEPAEPLPPLTDDDREFEKFQMVMVSSIQEEMDKMISKRITKGLSFICSELLRQYGHLDSKMNFYQNLRSRSDFVYRHSLNVTILCAMITRHLNISVDDRQRLILAAMLHDIGRIKSKNPAVFGAVTDVNLKNSMYAESSSAYEMIEDAFASEGAQIKRICSQVLRTQMDIEQGAELSIKKMVPGAKILLVANKYDEITGMSLSGESISEVRAIKEFLKQPEIYDREVINALIKSVNILFPGVSVELNTGDKALVLTENKEDILRPTVLSFGSNTVIDLKLQENKDIYVIDVMKTLDNRYIMNTDSINNLGGL